MMVFCYFLIIALPLTIVIFLVPQVTSTTTTNAVDKAALEDLYYATNSALNWNLGTDPCVMQWSGIDCTLVSKYYYVSQLTLIGSSLLTLSGMIPNSIGNFSYLYHLDLSQNSLSGKQKT